MFLINQVRTVTPRKGYSCYMGKGSNRSYNAIRLLLLLTVSGLQIHPLNSQPAPNRAPGIGSATVIHKEAGPEADRWEITFHDALNKNRVLWILVKTDRGKSFLPGSYRFRKKPFSAFGKRDILGVVYQDKKETPVRKGRVKLAISGQELSLHARLRLKNSGTLSYGYEGRFRIIELKE